MAVCFVFSYSLTYDGHYDRFMMSGSRHKRTYIFNYTLWLTGK